MKKKAVVLLSGGLDSTTILAIAKKSGFEIYALSFLYGQRHKIELNFAKKNALKYKAKEYKVAKIDLRTFGGSALTADIDVPKNRALSDKKIPITYVPARNTIFLSYALAYAEVIGASDIFIGVNAIDFSGYPDCRPNFIKAFERMANLATAASVNENSKIKIHTPLMKMSKKEIILTGLKLGVDYSQTYSCYDPIISGKKITECKKCDSCQLRIAGFKDANLHLYNEIKQQNKIQP